MKILVTVGSTPFPSLMAAADNLAAQNPSYSVRCQTAQPELVLQHAQSFAWTAAIAEEYATADVVVTHAGAGSVYSLLEQAKVMVVVPNTERADPHQLELARYVHENGFAVVCSNVTELADNVALALQQPMQPYHKERFFLAASLVRFLA